MQRASKYLMNSGRPQMGAGVAPSVPRVASKSPLALHDNSNVLSSCTGTDVVDEKLSSRVPMPFLIVTILISG